MAPVPAPVAPSQGAYRAPGQTAPNAPILLRKPGGRRAGRAERNAPSVDAREVDGGGTPGGLGRHHAEPGAVTAGEQADAPAPADAAAPDGDQPKPKPANGFVPDEVDFSLNGRTDVPEAGYVGGAQGSMSLWLQPEWAAGNQDDATLAQLGDVLQLVKNVNYLRFELHHEEGMLGVGAPVTEWQPGDWHLVTATWNGNEISLFLDGQLVNTTKQSIQIDLPRETTMSVGSDFPESRPVAPGMIGRVGLWRRPLAADEIAAYYDTGTKNGAPTR